MDLWEKNPVGAEVQEVIDKVAEVIDGLYMKKTPSKEVSLEIKGLFRDVVPWCSDEKFRGWSNMLRLAYSQDLIQTR